MKLYVAGPMTGLPEFNFPAFRAAAAALREVGYEVLDPSRHDPVDHPEWEWADYLRRDIPDVLVVDGLALLPGWENSRGARLEHHIATELGIPRRPVGEWLADRMEVAS